MRMRRNHLQKLRQLVLLHQSPYISIDGGHYQAIIACLPEQAGHLR
jgi:hypothetical protein